MVVVYAAWTPQATLFKAMLDHGVFMEGAVLKSNIVNPGKSCPTPYTAAQIAQANLDVFRRCVLPAAPRSSRPIMGRVYRWKGRVREFDKRTLESSHSASTLSAGLRGCQTRQVCIGFTSFLIQCVRCRTSTQPTGVALEDSAAIPC